MCHVLKRYVFQSLTDFYISHGIYHKSSSLHAEFPIHFSFIVISGCILDNSIFIFILINCEQFKNSIFLKKKIILTTSNFTFHCDWCLWSHSCLWLWLWFHLLVALRFLSSLLTRVKFILQTNTIVTKSVQKFILQNKRFSSID